VSAGCWAAQPRPVLAAAIERLRAGGLVAFPTETVWGLGADARSAAALERLRRWKGRGEAQPVAILVEGVASLAALGLVADTAARRLADAFWPGPLTLVLPCRAAFAPGVARADGAVGVRCSPHPVAAALAAAAARAGVGPLTATSLNRHGEPPARTRAEAERLCAGDGDAPLVVGSEGPDAEGGEPSTVVDCSSPRPNVLRWGAIDRAALARAGLESRA
jgi:L-threonylcarbamoyladenylate synthase